MTLIFALHVVVVHFQPLPTPYIMLFPLKNQILKRTTMIEKGMAINMMMNRKICIIARR